jgi:predicted small integral membrane protein
MFMLRVAKIVMCAAIAVFSLLVTFGNITDYGSNFEFVKHVMSMDTIFPDNKLMYRAITSEVLWNLGYCGIIAGEALTSFFLVWGCAALVFSLRADARSFNRAKTPVIVGGMIGFVVWYFGFMVIGGEWFAMWQSKSWNGQEAAFRIYMTILVVLIFVTQPDPELA